MCSFGNLNKAVSAVESQVLLHPLVGVQPNFVQPEPDRSLICKVKQCCSIALSLFIGLHCYAVDQKMICAFFQNGDPCWLTFNFQNPNLFLFNARPVILCGRFWDRAEYRHIGRNVSVRANPLDRFLINRIGSPEFNGGCAHGGVARSVRAMPIRAWLRCGDAHISGGPGDVSPVAAGIGPQTQREQIGQTEGCLDAQPILGFNPNDTGRHPLT